MNCCVPYPLSNQKLQSLTLFAKDFAVSHGIVMRQADKPLSADVAAHAAFSLLPSPVPRHCFEDAVRVQTSFNALFHRIAHDYDFLKAALSKTILADDFTRNLWNIYETVRQEGISQPLCLALTRSDYMFDCALEAKKAPQPACCNIKQIEYNTIASSFGGLSSQVSLLHGLLVQSLTCCDGCPPLSQSCPPNKAADGLANGMIAAWDAYASEKAVILFVVQDPERNIYDQRFLEFALLTQRPNIRCLRRSLQQLQGEATLREDKALIVAGEEVALVYFRAAYTPSDIQSQLDWDTRLLIERSKAIKCPNISYQLAGSKKVQQVLSNPGVVEKYISDPEEVLRIRNTFVQLHSLDLDEEGDKAVKLAIENPEKYVLKPQREGGGNNVYGEDIRTLLQTLGKDSEREGYILMERVFPASFKNYLLRPNSEPALCEVISELGIFGIVLGTEKEIRVNEQQGHILRTKTTDTDEGGVATGYSALDSPFAVD